MHKSAVRPSSTVPFSLYRNWSFSCMKIFRMKQIIDRAGIMSHWKLEILVLLVRLLKVSKKGRYFLAKRRRQLLKLREYLLCSFNCVRDLQGNHSDRQSLLKNNRSCLRIEEDIELCSWTPVSYSDSSSHYSNLSYLLFNIRKCF